MVLAGSIFFAAFPGFAQYAANLPWPPHLATRFMVSCAKYNQQLFPHCRCVYEKLRAQIPYAEFEQLATQNKIIEDARYLNIRTACVRNPAIRSR